MRWWPSIFSLQVLNFLICQSEVEGVETNYQKFFSVDVETNKKFSDCFSLLPWNPSVAAALPRLPSLQTEKEKYNKIGNLFSSKSFSKFSLASTLATKAMGNCYSTGVEHTPVEQFPWGHGFDSYSVLGYFSSHPIPQWSVLNQVPLGGATQLIFPLQIMNAYECNLGQNKHN